jgi:hypothetical protein
MEWRNAEGRLDRVPEIMRELVSIIVDVRDGHCSNGACSQGGDANDPHCHGGHRQFGEEGLIESLARPGGNVTGPAAGLSHLIQQL